MILGLDISTSCVGWCVLTSEGNLLKMGYIPLSKETDTFSKASRVSKELSWLNIEYEIAHVFIEENLQAFRPGLSSAKTLLTLARFNGIVSYICHKEFSIAPVNINVNSARKALEIKIKKKSDKSTKEQIIDWVSGRLNYDWPTKKLKSGPRKGKVILEPSCYDMADAYVIALAGKCQMNT
jgi:Holliday junction resolvasome RuvABC endonuclease subunit